MPRIKQSDGSSKGHERKVIGQERQIVIDEAGTLVVMSENEMIQRRYKLTKTNEAPTITSSPADRSVTAGASTTFTVVATGTAPLSYQWKRNGINISGATGSSYTLSNAQMVDAGAIFTCTVTNVGGSKTSTPCTLQVTAIAPTITTQPVSITRNAGVSASFSVSASGTTPLSYQWRRNGVDIPGATSASYSFTPAPSDTGAVFACTVTNVAGSATSNNATLTVTYSAISISAQPANRSVFSGGSTSFTISASGTGISYQWKKNGVNVGTNSSTYSYSNAAGADNGAVITCVVSNAWESVTSNPATLSVIYFSTQPVAPAPITPTTSPRPTLTVAVTGPGPYTYQWYVDGYAVPSATSSSFQLNDGDVTFQNGNVIYCRVTSVSPAGSINSNSITLSVTGFLASAELSASGWTQSACIEVGVNPSDGRDIYSSNSYYTDSVKRSTDSGATWSAALGTFQFSAPQLARVIGSTLIVGRGQGNYKKVYDNRWTGSAWSAIAAASNANLVLNEFPLGGGGISFAVRNVASGQPCIFKHSSLTDSTGVSIGFTGDYPPMIAAPFANDSYYAPLQYAFRASYSGNALVFASPTGNDRLRTWVNGVLDVNADNSYARPNDALISNDGSKIVFVCAAEGLPRYIHGGVTNASQIGTLPAGVTNIWPVLGQRGDLTTIYALARYQAISTAYPYVALLKSTDYGVTWTRIGPKVQLSCQSLPYGSLSAAQDSERVYVAYWYGASGKLASRFG